MSAQNHHRSNTLVILGLFVVVVGAACRKELSCEDCINGNRRPIAVAGDDQFISLPTDSVTLDGSLSKDPDGKITSWTWVKVGGPNSSLITDGKIAKTKVRNLDTGVHTFELTVTDDGGLSDRDTVRITVSSLHNNRPPVARAGNDTIIVLSANGFILDGSGSSDPDQNITGYRWRQISGMSTNIANPDSPKTSVRFSIGGKFEYELRVMDAGGLFSMDTVIINVLTISGNCDQSTRPLVNMRLTPAGNLSQARWGMAVAAVGNKIVFAGGFSENYNASDRVDIHDVTTGAWTTAKLSQARMAMAVAILDNRIFFAGGFSNNGPSSRIDVYDVRSNTWSTAELSKPRAYLAGAAAGNKVLFAGGFGGFYYDSTNNGLYLADILDVSSNRWTTDTIPSLFPYEPSIAGYAGVSAAVVGDKIYLAGNASDWFHWGGGTITGAVDAYDVRTGQWSKERDLTQPRGFIGTRVMGNKIIWAGGVSGEIVNENSVGTYSNLVEIRDMVTGVSTIGCLSRYVGFLSNLQQGNKIVFFGSEQEVIEANPVDIYDAASNAWSIGLLPVSIRGASVISINNRMYVAGGYINGNLSNQLLILDF